MFMSIVCYFLKGNDSADLRQLWSVETACLRSCLLATNIELVICSLRNNLQSQLRVQRFAGIADDRYPIASWIKKHGNRVARTLPPFGICKGFKAVHIEGS